MASSSISSSSTSSKYPKPIYMDYDLQFIPKLSIYSVNYWKICMLNHMEANGLIAFIDGSIQPPPADNLADFMEWKQVDDFVRQSIMSTLREDFLSENSNLLSYANTSAQLWNFIIQNVHPPPRMTHPDRVLNHVPAERPPNFNRYLPLYKAAVEGDLKSLEEILDKDPTAVRAAVTGAYDTVLIVASQKKGNHEIIKRLISLMSPQDLAMQSSFGRTALACAAVAGNVEAMALMVEKNPSLPHIPDIYNQIPLHLAAFTGQNDSLKYLLQVTDEVFFKDTRGLFLVHSLIQGGFFDICLSLLQHYPALATMDVSPLESLIRRHSAFLSGSDFSFWQRMIYSYLPTELESLKNYCTSTGDIENPLQDVAIGSNRRMNLSQLFWQLAGKFVPQIKPIQEKKLMHIEALQLLRFIFSEIAKLEGKQVRDFIGGPLEEAAAMGNVEVVEEILTLFPNALYLLTVNKHSVFHIAIATRKANVFNLIYQITIPRHLILAQRDVSYNTALHLVAHMTGDSDSVVSYDLRSSGPGAALQMQRELQWFKEVEKLSWPQDQEAWNMNGKTPAIIFTETHEMLAKEGEQWMKDRANSGIIIATLIATIVFASAITVPGGSSSDTGLPLFSKHQAFLFFAVSDALALFMSASSMLMFLGILTARYAVQDFLYSLPKRLIIALITLFLSIIFMMIAFTAILYLVFGDEKRWVLGLVSSLATIPVLLFALLQFKPLLEIISCTYGPGIFGKRGDRILL